MTDDEASWLSELFNLVGGAPKGALNAWEEEFIADMRERFDEEMASGKNFQFSPKQWEKLNQIREKL